MSRSGVAADVSLLLSFADLAAVSRSVAVAPTRKMQKTRRARRTTRSLPEQQFPPLLGVSPSVGCPAGSFGLDDDLRLSSPANPAFSTVELLT